MRFGIKVIGLLGVAGCLSVMTACKKTSGTGGSGEEGSLESTVVRASELDGEMSKDLKDFRDQLLKVKSQIDVAKLIDTALDKLDKNEYKDNDIRFVAAQLIPLKVMHGIIWRMTPIVENKSDTIHTIVVSSMMAIAAGTRIFVPQNWNDSDGAHTWKSINRYIAWPYQGLTPDKQFQTVKGFQDFLGQELYVALGKSADIIEKISIPASKPLVWDNLMVFGNGAFGADTDSKDRYATIYEGEKLIVLSGLYAMRHNILLFRQYNFEDFPSYAKDMARRIGMEGVGVSGVNGASARDRAVVLCGNEDTVRCKQYPNLFKRFTDFNVMQEAYTNLDKSTDYLEKAWADIKSRGAQQPSLAGYQLLDPAKILPWTRLNDATVGNIRAMVKGQPVRSSVSGKMVRVDVPKFYSNPPDDLKSFLPLTFDTSQRRITVDGVANVRNYEYGMSNQWNPAAYTKYFPDITNGYQVPIVMRELSQVWGGWFANTGLATVSMVF